jgi:hypothetical protein
LLRLSGIVSRRQPRRALAPRCDGVDRRHAIVHAPQTATYGARIGAEAQARLESIRHDADGLRSMRKLRSRGIAALSAA